MPSLRDLLEIPWALPADLGDDGESVLVQNKPKNRLDAYPMAVAFLEEVLGGAP